MCDTLVALPSHTASGNLLFAKNSDREPNEAQVIERIPAREWTEATVACTYIRIPQVRHTGEVILSRPFHMWGAEMGANEHGVVIGNEAVFTRVRIPRRNTGLTGMDLLRLALERAHSAEAALECITGLLEAYGQDACGGYRNRNFFYHNSFLIADAASAWVLETADRHWAARRVRDTASISNGLTIGGDYDLISREAIDFAYRRRWLRSREPFNFQRAYADWFMSRMSSCQYRQRRTSGAVTAAAGRFSAAAAMELLASHRADEGEFEPHRGSTADICMHATGLTNPSQTTGSMIAEIRRDGPATIWLTGASMPCLSVYLPFFFGGDTLTGDDWPRPGAQPDDSLWWQAERLHRRLCKDYRKGRALIDTERRERQRGLLEAEAALITRKTPPAERDDFSRQALAAYRDLLRQWESRAGRIRPRRRSRNPLYWLHQYRNDSRAGFLARWPRPDSADEGIG